MSISITLTPSNFWPSLAQCETETETGATSKVLFIDTDALRRKMTKKEKKK